MRTQGAPLDGTGNGSRVALVLSCEHGGNRVPKECRRLFASAGDLLRTHRAWDLGALPVARFLAETTGAPLFFSETTRLLVDLNRSEHNRNLFSDFTRDLPVEAKRALLDMYWRPHRDAVDGAVGALVAAGRVVVHVAVHSFTPVLHGLTRATHVGLLFDPARRREARLASAWQVAIQSRGLGLTVHRNAPYRGVSDSLPTALRSAYPAAQYLGLELEVNQGLAAAPASPAARRLLARLVQETLVEALGLGL